MVETDRRLDMESPNYAKWIPEAGGYVHNGSKVSATPLYDDAGNFKVDVDLSQLQTSQPAVHDLVGRFKVQPDGSVKNVSQEYALMQTGQTQANQIGSGIDANAAATGVGALASVADNKENSDFGVLNTPATQSTSAEEPILSPLDQVNRDYEYMVATNNLKGQIDALTKRSQMTGEDFSAVINDLNQQRNKKILAQDDAYGQAITQAFVNGDYQAVAQLQQEQADWRNKVGFGEAQQVEYQARKDDIQVQYVDAYRTGLNDINNALINTFGQFLNFQYNPNTDMALQVAQGYAVGAVKEQMNHTGMYYSSMTQSAITRAVAELVPVYEKMAKDEMKQNIQMLMSLGNYLMDLEQTQFNMWKGQIDVQLELNQEKRREYQAAMDRANAWGYVSNEDSVILGVAPGSPSPQAMQEARQAQLELDKEQRELQTKLILADYNNSLEIKKMYEEAKVDDYYSALKQQRDFTNSWNLNAQKHGYAMEEENLKSYNDRLLQSMKGTGNSSSTNKTTSQILTNAGFNSDAVTKFEELLSEDKTPTQIKTFFENNKLTEDSLKTSKELNDLLSNAYEKNTDDPLGASAINALYSKDQKAVIDNANASLLSAYTLQKIIPEIDEAIGFEFGEDYDKTKTAYDNAVKIANNYASIYAKLDYGTKDQEIEGLYKHIIDEINSAGAFDYSKTNFYDDYNKLKIEAEEDIVSSIKKNKDLGKNRDQIANNVQTYIDYLKSQNMTGDKFNEPNYRDDLINNTVREGLARAGMVYNGVSNIANQVTQSPYFSTAMDTLGDIGYQAVTSQIPGVPAGINLNGTLGQAAIRTGMNKLGGAVASKVVDNISNKIKNSK